MSVQHHNLKNIVKLCNADGSPASSLVKLDHIVIKLKYARLQIILAKKKLVMTMLNTVEKFWTTLTLYSLSSLDITVLKEHVSSCIKMSLK